MIRELWEQRSPREKLFLSLAALLIGYVLVTSPAGWLKERLATLDRKTEQRRNDLKEAVRLAGEHDRLSARLNRLQAKSPGGGATPSLLSFLENVSTRVGTRQRIVSMKPQAQTTPEGVRESSVDVRIENVDLGELVGMLALIEDSPEMLQIPRLRIKTRYNDPQRLDASFTVSALESAPPPSGSPSTRSP